MQPLDLVQPHATFGYESDARGTLCFFFDTGQRPRCGVAVQSGWFGPRIALRPRPETTGCGGRSTDGGWRLTDPDQSARRMRPGRGGGGAWAVKDKEKRKGLLMAPLWVMCRDLRAPRGLTAGRPGGWSGAAGPRGLRPRLTSGRRRRGGPAMPPAGARGWSSTRGPRGGRSGRWGGARAQPGGAAGSGGLCVGARWRRPVVWRAPGAAAAGRWPGRRRALRPGTGRRPFGGSLQQTGQRLCLPNRQTQGCGRRQEGGAGGGGGDEQGGP